MSVNGRPARESRDGEQDANQKWVETVSSASTHRAHTRRPGPRLTGHTFKSGKAGHYWNLLVLTIPWSPDDDEVMSGISRNRSFLRTGQAS